MNKIFNVNDLKITKTGQFMVTMPCNIRISKMILHSLQFGITYTMIDIAAILLTQKQFFLHE
jgi:HrpA-like RNA helicase